MTSRSNGWACLVPDHDMVEWRDDVAYCVQHFCELTSDMTNTFAHQMRVRQREDDAQAVRRLADQLTHNYGNGAMT